MATPPQSPALASKRVLPAWLDKLREHRGLIVPVGFVMLMVVLLVPLPPVLLDLLIVLNITLGVVILLTTLYMEEPLDFSVFPSLLLATTLIRLTLNVASTRLILTADAETPEEAVGVAGSVISAFGEFVAGDSLVVGVIIFLILVIVQFMVVTKGAGRVSEVAARFTLDAMPGKQMAIDSDLNAGIITEQEAKDRRETIRREADFFGSMDGASKFVKGDATASIIITAINIVGGFAIGVFDRGWNAGQTAEVFTKLTIGDGLTSQIPSLIIAIASAMIVTRSGSKDEVGKEFADQLTSQPRGLLVAALFLSLLAVSPLPTVPLFAAALALAAISLGMTRAAKGRATEEADAAGEPAAAGLPEPEPVENLLKVDTMELEVGYGLVGLVDKGSGGDLLDRITGIRRQLAAELGLVMPPVRIRDNVELETDHYRIKIRGNTIGEGRLRADRVLAMDSGIASGKLEGEKTTEPAFGLDAWWIEPRMAPRAESMNYTIVEPSNVLATHLSELVKTNAGELLTREEVANLVEGLKQRAPKLVEEVVPAIVKPGELQKVLQGLLAESVPIRDLETVLEVLAEWAPKTKDTEILVEYTRNGLKRTISSMHSQPGQNGKPVVVCAAVDPELEDRINAYIDRGPNGTNVSMPARIAEAYAGQIVAALEPVTSRGSPPVVIASPPVRQVVWQILRDRVPGVAVLGYNEIAPGTDVETVGLARVPEEARLSA